MTILSSLNTSLTSLFTFSKSLDVISDNLANLNSAGFKANELLLRDLGNASPEGFSQNYAERGQGVEVTGTIRRFTQGELRQTGTDTHLAIDGSGFFAVMTPDGVRYTRAGQFQVDAEGKFVDAVSGAVLQRLADGSGVANLVINRTRTSPPQATKTVALSGNLSSGGTTHSINNVAVFDADGKNRNLSLVFTNQSTTTPGSWKVVVSDAQGSTLLEGEIRFQGTGAPAIGFNSLDIQLVSDSGARTTVTLGFGEPGTLDGATSFSSGTTSTLAVKSSDGFGLGTLAKFTIGRDGNFELEYSNGQKEAGPQVAIAQFDDPQQLRFVGGSQFEVPVGLKPTYVAPTTAGAGGLVSGSLELANVELTSEFAQILILQRGFQSSSQVLNVSSELIETLYNSVSGKR